MKNVIVEISDLKESFIYQLEQNTTPFLLAEIIQQANYYEQFNLSEIFYFQIKGTENFFSNRFTPIYKYLNNIENPTLIFYKGLKSLQLFQKGQSVEDNLIKMENQDKKYSLNQSTEMRKYPQNKIEKSQQRGISTGEQSQVVNSSSVYNPIPNFYLHNFNKIKFSFGSVKNPKVVSLQTQKKERQIKQQFEQTNKESVLLEKQHTIKVIANNQQLKDIVQFLEQGKIKYQIENS